MIRKLRAIALVAWLSLPSTGTAHSGHGRDGGHGLLHYLAELEHALPIVVLLAVGALVWGFRVRRAGASQRPGRPPV